MSYNGLAVASVFTIEDGVPFPDDDSHRYPLHRLEVGQSFFVPDGEPARLAKAIREVEQRMGRRFSARSWTQVHPSGHGPRAAGARVWRMPDDWRHPPSFYETGLDSDGGA
jgi:hypothetical protein